MLRSAAVLLLAGCVLCAAMLPPGSAQEGPNLAEGVTHVALPPGTLRLERIFKKGKPLLRMSVDKTVIEARVLFLGDGKGATKFEATKEGIHWAGRIRKKGFVVDGTKILEPGGTIEVYGGGFWTVDQLPPGSVYVTTPSSKFVFKKGKFEFKPMR